jgi:hypothetical protein
MCSILVNWLSEVATEYKVSDKALHFGISIFDTVLARGPTCSELYDNNSDSDDDSNKENKKPKYFVIHRVEFQALGW